MKEEPSFKSADTLLDDILSLIHARELACKTELTRLDEYKKVFVPGGVVAMVTANDSGVPMTVAKPKRHMTAAARARISRAQKARWAKQRRHRTTT